MDHEHHKHSTGKAPEGNGDGKHRCEYRHGASGHAHEHHGHHAHGPDVKPPFAAKYFCPMCEGVVSDKPGDCPKCGMALERNPAYKPEQKTIYTCPMHPEIQRDHPGDCPKC